jgi:hypothetical protein
MQHDGCSRIASAGLVLRNYRHNLIRIIPAKGHASYISFSYSPIFRFGRICSGVVICSLDATNPNKCRSSEVEVALLSHTVRRAVHPLAGSPSPEPISVTNLTPPRCLIAHPMPYAIPSPLPSSVSILASRSGIRIDFLPPTLHSILYRRRNFVHGI